MGDNSKNTGSSQLFEFTRDSYLDRTSRPVYALTYLIGFIILYEIGTFLISTEILSNILLDSTHVRVVSFAWIQNLMTDWLKFPARLTWITTPLVVVVILVALQITSKTGWKVQFWDFVPMTVECLLLAVPLIALGLMINSSAPEQAAMMSASESTNNLAVDLVTSIGAGIYEELIFRLILISFLMMFFQDLLRVSRRNSIILSVLISSVLFSAHHHIYFIGGSFIRGEDFVLSVFIFRVLAGAYFAGIFTVRGFAISVGTHAFYNIMVAFLKFFFS